MRSYFAHVAIYGGALMVLAFAVGVDEKVRSWAEANRGGAILFLLVHFAFFTIWYAGRSEERRVEQLRRDAMEPRNEGEE